MHLEDHTLPCVLYHHGEIDEVVSDSIARADSYWRIIISRYLNAPVRVGSSYRVGYYFIYFPVVVQNTGKRVVLQVHGSVEVCRITISRYL